jgi:glycerate 2-kinase
MRDHLLQAFQAGIKAVQPDRAIRHFVERTTDGCKITNRFYSTGDLRILTVGKAATAMAETLADLLGDKVKQGLVVSPQVGQKLPDNWRLVLGNHPLPGTGSLAAGQAVRDLLVDCTADTLLLVGVSGGATALMIDPPPEISLDTLRSIYQTLLVSGADISEMNAVRSRLDRIKAGGLVDLAAPAQVVGLIISDVVGDDLAIIGSGLTVHTAFPSENQPTAHNTLIGSNHQACVAASDLLQSLGYQPQIVTTQMTGVASSQGRSIAQTIQAAAPGTALIYGGETTVTLPLDCPGLGGRNQELVLAAAIELQNYPAAVWLGSIGTDGIDGNNPAAGAIIETQTWRMAKAQEIMAEDYLDRHDSYNFFQQLGQAIIIGATGTNVADLSIALKPK